MTPAAGKRTRRPRGSIDADMILRGAFEVANNVGLENMSMPNLAAHLEVGVTSIYWYFRNKEDLLQVMHSQTSAWLQQRLPQPSAFTPDQWREYLTQAFTALHSAYQINRVAAELMMNRHAGQSASLTRDSFQQVEQVMEFLVAAGFELQTAWRLYATVSMYTHNFVSMEQLRATTGFPPQGAEQLTLLNPPAMPLISELIGERDESLDFTGDGFLDGIELILDGAENRLLQKE